MEDKKGFSFGFSKKIEKKSLEQSQISDEKLENAKPKDFVTSLEHQKVNSTQQSKDEKPKEYVIPLITKNNWRKKEGDSSVKDSEQTEEESQAVKELIEDASKRNENWEDRGKIDPNLSIPLILRNKIPEGYETDDKLDVSLRPEEPSEVDYDEVPIEHFGTAMLRGMGWKEGEGIGKKPQNFKPIDAQLRPKGLGLGADRSKALQLNETKVAGSSNKEKEQDKLVLKVGAFCVVEKGSNKDRYGKIEGLDEDNARVIIKLAVSGVMVTQSQYSLRLVDQNEYSKYSKYLNKGKVDKYKKEQERKSKDSERKRHREDGDQEDGHRHRDDSDIEERLSGSDRHRDREHTDRKRSRGRNDREDKHSSKKHKDSDRYSSKHSLSHSSSSSNGHSRSSKQSLWLRPQIRVRIVDDKYKKGRYFNTKVEVVDVLGIDNCMCKTEDGKLLEGLSQDKLETVIPKSDPGFVILINGKWKGELGEIVKKDRQSCKALVQLLSDRDECVSMDYDSICEYMGDIHAELDF